MSTTNDPGTSFRNTPRLRLNTGSGEPTVVELEPGRNTIGRDASNDIQLDEPTVSDAHCVIELTGGAIAVHDLGSTNGTFIDGEPIQDGVLRPGQILRLGEVELIAEGTDQQTLDPSEVLAARPGTTPPFQAAISAQAIGQEANCVNHSDTRPGWICTDCAARFCNACVKRVKLEGSRTVSICPACQGLCEPLSRESRGTTSSFTGGMVGALAYPLRDNGPFMLVGLAVLTAVMDLLARSLAVGMMLGLVGLGVGLYVLSYLREIVVSSADGESRLPSWPDFQAQALGGSIVQWLGVYLVSFGPWMLTTRLIPPEARWLSPALLGLGCAYFPMAVLAVTIYDDLAALNPVLVLVSVARTLVRYLILCLLLGVALGAAWVSERATGGPSPPMLGTVLSGVLWAYAGLVGARAIGWFYYCSKDQLAWS
jgi:pSer/pThr/pTyr-binding forkhead associated (FHA) protein